jgi:hypothetical protein
MSGRQGNQGQPSTTGQGGAQQPSANQPSANQPPANQQQGGQDGNQPPTTGQGGAGQNNQGSGPTNMNPNNMDRGAQQQPSQPSQRCERVRHRAFTHGVAADIAAALCKMAGREAAPGNRDEDETNQTIACGIDRA